MKRFELMAPVLLTGIGGLLLIGCAELPLQGAAEIQVNTKSESIQSPAGPAGSITRQAHVVVPFFPDDTDQCGPATLASILTYWGVPSDPLSLREEIYLRRLRGTLAIDLLLATQARGLWAEGSSGTLEMLKAELDADHPVVALLNLGWVMFPQGHYVVVTGYDERRQGLYMHSGLARDVFVPYAGFLANWEKTGRWMLRVWPLERLTKGTSKVEGG